jgi:nicotinate-nucleotide adenylyltransferase
MKTLYLGGSFNPIHHAHLICARAAAEAMGFDRILLLPSAVPPHKTNQRKLAGSADRLHMAELAVAGHALFAVSDLELRRSGPSYTIDTVRQLKANGESQVHWLIGADAVMQLPGWREPEALLHEVTFVVMDRPGTAVEFSRLPPAYRRLESHRVTVPQLDISSSEIRRRVQAGLSIDFLTPPAVVEFIGQRGLYR